MQITAATWIDATTAGRQWDQARDTARIRAAFSTLAQTRDQWPAPRHFLDAIPRMEQKAIGYEVKPATPEQAAKALATIGKLLDVRMPNHRAPLTQTPRADLAEAERELAKHYGKDAAAGPDA